MSNQWGIVYASIISNRHQVLRYDTIPWKEGKVRRISGNKEGWMKRRKEERLKIEDRWFCPGSLTDGVINDAHLCARTGSVIIGSPPLGYRHTFRPIVAPRHCIGSGTVQENKQKRIKRDRMMDSWRMGAREWIRRQGKRGIKSRNVGRKKLWSIG